MKSHHLVDVLVKVIPEIVEVDDYVDNVRICG